MRPRRLSHGDGERSTDAGRGEDERRHVRVPRRRFRPGLGGRGRARRHLPGQHVPGLELRLQRPVRTGGRGRPVRGAGPHLRRGLPSRRRRRSGAAGGRGPGPRVGGDGGRVGRRHRARAGDRPPALERRAQRPRRVPAGRTLDLLPALLHSPGHALRGRNRRDRRPVRQAPVRARRDGAHREHRGARDHDGGLPNHARTDAEPRPDDARAIGARRRRHARRARVRRGAHRRAAPFGLPAPGDPRDRRPQAPPAALALRLGRVCSPMWRSSSVPRW